MKQTIQIGKRGGGLAFRIPKALSEKYGLKVGSTIDSEIVERALAGSMNKLENR